MFDKKGKVRVRGKGGSKDDEMLELIDVGAEDVEDFEEDGQIRFLVYTESTILSDVADKLKEAGFEVESQEVIFKPNMTVEVGDREAAEKVINFTERLEDHDDIQKVHANFDIPDELVRG
jgi:transcriptional/translational regulatory protein YebC/TACO1